MFFCQGGGEEDERLKEGEEKKNHSLSFYKKTNGLERLIHALRYLNQIKRIEFIFKIKFQRPNIYN